MYICIYIYLDMYSYVYIYIETDTYIQTNLYAALCRYVYLNMNIHIYMHIHEDVYMYAYAYVYSYICICVSMHVHVYEISIGCIHIFTHTEGPDGPSPSSGEAVYDRVDRLVNSYLRAPPEPWWRGNLEQDPGNYGNSCGVNMCNDETRMTERMHDHHLGAVRLQR